MRLVDVSWPEIQRRSRSGDASARVKTGHSAWFDASRHHAYRNVTAAPVMFALVVLDSAADRMGSR